MLSSSSSQQVRGLLLSKGILLAPGAWLRQDAGAAQSDRGDESELQEALPGPPLAPGREESVDGVGPRVARP